MKTKIISILALLLTVTQGAWAADPFGYWGAEGQNGSINVSGWAYDSDESSTSIRVHVYVWKKGVNEGDMDHPYTAESLPTDWERPDVNETMHITGVHGFRSTISIAEAGTYVVKAFGINVGDGANAALIEDQYEVNVSAPYSVTYDANGGSGAPSAQEKRTDIDLTLSSTVPTRTGYTFDGWATSADGVVAYAAGATYTGNADLSLYAKWTANTYSVHFNGNGSTSGSMDNESFTYDEAKTLTTNAFSRTGYTFDGWATTADEAVAYTDGQSVSNLTAENGATVELFAHWSSNTTTSGIDWDPSTDSGTFLMPAYNVEVSTELWYILKQNGETPADNETKTNVFLDRTLQSLPGDNKGWNTFCAPFDISAEKVSALGMTVKAFTGSTLSGGTLTLHFETASSIAAGTPYLVQVASNLNFAADGNEFAGVTQDWTAHNATSTYADFVPVLEPTELTANDPNVLFVYGGNELGHPSVTGNILGFRAYFQLKDAAASVKAFAMSFDDEVATGISSLTPNPSPVGEGSVYTLDGRKVNGQPTRKGVYIVNGKKTIIK